MCALENDEAIIKRHRANDPEALSDLVTRYYARRLFYYEKNLPSTWKRLGEGECNSVFFSTVLDTVVSYRPGRVHYSAYFQKALKNNLLRSAREMGLLAEPVLSLDHYEGEEEEGSCLHDVVAAPSSYQDSPIEAIERSETAKALRLALKTLTPQEETFIRARAQGMKLQEISKQYHVSMKKTRVVLNRALAKLKKSLKGYHLKDLESLL
jgi:RNA polymerase sigma factor (sigma-70 family)